MGTRLSDYDSPEVQAVAARLTKDAGSDREAAEQIFDFMRDDILFGLPPIWDSVRASQTLGFGVGYCNTKATLFHALCRAAGVESRLHTGAIRKEVLYGILPPLAYPMLGARGSHTWVELRLDGEWRPVDSYINDIALYRAADVKLTASGRETGYSLSRAAGPTSPEFNFGDKGHVHMGAVVEDHGVWDDFSQYMKTDKYLGMSRAQLMVYPALARMTNNRVARMRLNA